MTQTKNLGRLSAFIAALVLGFGLANARDLTFDERVQAQRAIETVYWRHRIWPKDNAAPKPSLDAVMPESAMRAKVEDYLRKSTALENFWQRPVTSPQLQAELNRMAANTHDGAVLVELFDALGNDPSVIAQTLARQTLVDRLARNWYAAELLDTDESNRRLEDLAVVGSPKRSFDDWWRKVRSAVSAEVPSRDGPFALPSIPLAACVNDTWTPTHLEAPDGRDRHTAVWTGSEMIVWGGSNRGYLNTGGRYNPATDTWTPTSRGTNVPVARAGQTAVWTGTQMLVWGGSSADASLSDGGRYDPLTDSWLPISTGANVPSPRFLHSAVWTGAEMIVWGGFTRLVTADNLGTGARYDPSSDSWTPTSLGASAPRPRGQHMAVWTGTEMIIWGGSSTAGDLKDGSRYSPSSDTWTPVASAPWLPVEWNAVWTGTEMIVWGGYLTKVGGRYNPSTNTWAPTSTGSNCPSPRVLPSVTWTGTEMIVWGGGGPANEGGGRYNPVSDTWLRATTVGAPSYRYRATAVWTGTEMIVWGGIPCETFCEEQAFNSGGRYNPATDSWVPTLAEVNVPTPRTAPTAVWTGAEMIVWGGNRGETTQNVNSGGRYVPATDSWLPTSVGANVPAARNGHTAVWTGREMIVWGGTLGVYSQLNDGGRYDPLNDSWAPVSTGANVPASRASHTALWTGSEMLVWGGYHASEFCCSSVFNSGGRYNPITDQWQPTSTGVNVPGVRWAHAAVWTGTQMVVWGGFGLAQSPAPALGSGGRYSPATDTWSALSTAGAPQACAHCSAVWTENEMIVWGGDSGNVELGTGGRYAPSTDGWTAMSVGPNAPAARTYATGIWTGRELIVWGGNAHGAPGRFDDGGRYDPSTNSWTPTSRVSAPPPRYFHAAVWTGAEMIIWGGYPPFSTAGRYCACPSGQLVYEDADGDGFGDTGVTRTSCDGIVPAGFVAVGLDCDDSNANVHPGSIETCDGIDNDCNGLVDESDSGADSDGDAVHDVCDDCPYTANATQSDFDHDGEGDACDLNDGQIFEWRADKTSVSWQAEQGPTSWNVYFGDLDVLKAAGVYTQVSGSNELASRQCGASTTLVDDFAVPDVGKVSFSLVTGVTAGGEGSLGSSSAGPRPNQNPCP